MEDQKLTYAALSEMSNKIISFPELKRNIETNLLCKQCIYEGGLSAISASTLSMHQETYGIATILTISCGNNHVVKVIPDCIDNNISKHNIKNFIINYKLLILMQLLGKGLKTISVIGAFWGIQSSLGNYKLWKDMMDKLGNIQEELAYKCCNDNLQKEIDATKNWKTIQVMKNALVLQLVVMLDGKVEALV